MFLSGTRLGLEIVDEILQQTHILSQYAQTVCTETDRQFNRVQEELIGLESGLLERIKTLESVSYIEKKKQKSYIQLDTHR